MSEYRAEVQQILDNPADGDEPDDSAREVWSKLNFGDDPKFREFWSEVIGRSGTTWTTADAATATQFKDQLDWEDYVALMTPWWKATGLADWEIDLVSNVKMTPVPGPKNDEGYPTVMDMKKDHPSFATGGYTGGGSGLPAGFVHPSFYALAVSDEDIQRVGELVNELEIAESAPKSVRRSTLEEAANLIDGDRNKDYGAPWDNHRRIASLWTILFGHDVTPAQVAIAMALVKVARLVHTPDHHDSFVDGAAYLAIADELSKHKA